MFFNFSKDIFQRSFENPHSFFGREIFQMSFENVRRTLENLTGERGIK